MLHSIHYFRAIAILLIVAGHCDIVSNIDKQSFGLVEGAIYNLLIGGTALFVFISGFLFHHVFIPKYQYKKFVAGKIKNVLIPYLVLSAPIISYVLIAKPKWVDNTDLASAATFSDYFSMVTDYLISGGLLLAYWYIPFIMITFLMSPLHLKFARASTKNQLGIIAVSLAASAVLHRPIDFYYVFHHVIYYAPFYLIGIVCSIHKEKIYAAFSGREYYLLGLAVLFALFQSSLHHYANYNKSAFSWAGVDMMLFQKLMLSIFFMVWLHRFENTSAKALGFVAEISFSIFFLHGYLILLVHKLLRRFYDASDLSVFHLQPWLKLILLTIVIVAITSLIVVVVKKVIPKQSRYLIGY